MFTISSSSFIQAHDIFFPWIFLTQDWLSPWLEPVDVEGWLYMAFCLPIYLLMATYWPFEKLMYSTNLTASFSYFGCVPRSVIIWTNNHYIYFYIHFWLVELQQMSLCGGNVYTSLRPHFHSVSPSIVIFFIASK